MKNTQNDVKPRQVLGVYSDRNVVFMFFKESDTTTKVVVEVSSDGEIFGRLGGEIVVRDSKNKHISAETWNHLQVSRWEDEYSLIAQTLSGKTVGGFISQGRDLNWLNQIASTIKPELGLHLINNFKHQNKYVLISGGGTLSLSFSSDFINWENESQLVGGEKDFFGDMQLTPANVFSETNTLNIAYFVTRNVGNHRHFVLKALSVDSSNPSRIIRKPVVVWETPESWLTKNTTPIGIVKLGNQYVSYWQNSDGVWTIKHPWLFAEVFKEKFPEIFLERLNTNPIISPVTQNLWESRAVFNPAALTDPEGNVHMLYRAVGDDDVSVLGYARSTDGLHFDYRSPKPAFTLLDMSGATAKASGAPKVDYASGGGTSGGCEDPRLVRIGDRVFMTYISFNGWNSLRMALTSISWKDFINQEWNWETPVFISKPGEIHKNWVLFPQKINGKYALLHSVSPNITIDYFDSLDDFKKGTFVKSHYSKSGRKGMWDNWMRGAGPPPIKTEYGWLLLYHAMDSRDPNRYKLGAMLLDLNNPTKILSRSNHPILEPDETYENEGFKAGVIYSCGAVVKNNKLIVYYGGADTVICAATTKLNSFVTKLKKHRNQNVSPQLIKSYT